MHPGGLELFEDIKEKVTSVFKGDKGGDGNKSPNPTLESTKIGMSETVQQIMTVIILILSVLCLILYFSTKGIATQINVYQKTASEATSKLSETEEELKNLSAELEGVSTELATIKRHNKSYVRSYYDGSMVEHAFTVQEGTLKTDKLPMNFSASTYKDDVYTSRLGLDVSYFQGNIDWEKVANTNATGSDNYKFAFIRAAYRGYKNGELSEDEMFAKNIHGAYDNGLDVGVYVYSQAINEEEAKEEANLVLELLDREGFTPETLKYGIAYDPEKVIGSDEARTNDLEPEQWHKNAMAFLNTVKEAGYEATLYTNLEFEAENFDMTEAEDYNIWYAEYKEFPTTPYFYKFWQFTEGGEVEGINGKVDINIEFVERT